MKVNYYILKRVAMLAVLVFAVYNAGTQHHKIWGTVANECPAWWHEGPDYKNEPNAVRIWWDDEADLTHKVQLLVDAIDANPLWVGMTLVLPPDIGKIDVKYQELDGTKGMDVIGNAQCIWWFGTDANSVDVRSYGVIE